MKRALLATNAHALMLLPRFWLATDFAVDALRALGINHYLGVSRIERHLTPWFGGYISAPTLHALGWTQLACSLLLAAGFLTRFAVLPAALAIAAAFASWNLIGTLGTSQAIDATSHALALTVVGLILLIDGAGPISIDARLARQRRRKRRA